MTEEKIINDDILHMYTSLFITTFVQLSYDFEPPAKKF
jgi:hypothetical protein